jgi:flagellar biosynthesis protein FlhB
MSDEQDKGQDKTEEPTDKRRRDFREKGKVAQSKDLASVGVLLAIGLSVVAWWPHMMGRAEEVTRDFLADGPANPNLFVADPIALLRFVVATLAWMVAPILLAAVVSGLLLAVAQVGLMWTWKPMEFDLNKLHPINGLKTKLFSLQAVFEWLKAMGKVTVIGAVCWKVIDAYSPVLTEMASYSLGESAARTGDVVIRLVGFCLLAMLALGILDLLWAKWQLLRKMRMTYQEMKDEHKDTEGDPYMKARLRKMMHALTQNRLVSEVSESTVVIANPTHYAIAIKYEMGQPGPPRVVARGADARAVKIKDIARSEGIPRIENRPLARALYAQCKEGQEVPVDLYEAVAEVLAFVYRLRQSRRPASAASAAPAPAPA